MARNHRYNDGCRKGNWRSEAASAFGKGRFAAPDSQITLKSHSVTLGSDFARNTSCLCQDRSLSNKIKLAMDIAKVFDAKVEDIFFFEDDQEDG
jgi:hypothetical protein